MSNNNNLDPYTAQAQNNDVTPQEKIAGLKEIIKSTETAMLTSRSADGQFHSRAMSPVNPNNVSHKFEEIQHDSHVNVSFLNPTTTSWASFSGKAKVIQDRDEIKKYWSTATSAWFGDLKDGVHKGDSNDPRVALIQVIPDEIRYWYPTKGKVGRAIAIGVDAMTGKTSSPGELRTITSDECLYPAPISNHRANMTEESYQVANLDNMPSSNADRRSSTGIFSMPPEIWSAIFEFSKSMTDDDPLYEEGRIPPKVSFELSASHTCPFFRAVALGTPGLWTSLQINGSCSLEWVSECIGRSGSCWLDIIVEIGEHFPLDVDDLNVMMNLIVPHSRRWRSLSLSSPYEPAHNSIVALLGSSPAPGLRYLSLNVNDVEKPDQNAIDSHVSNPQIFEDGTPRLNFVRLRGLAPHLFRPRLETLETLHLDHIGHIPILYSTFRGVITQSPFLEHLSVYGDIISRNTWPGRADIIQLLKLRSLRVCGVGGEMYSGLLLGIDTPQLESLTLKDAQEEDLDPLWDLNDNTRYPKLTQLIFTNFDFSEVTYKRLCETFQEITLFSVLHSSIAESPLANLLMAGTVVGQNGLFIPWPKLRDVSFSFDGTNKEQELIQNVAEIRKERGCGLSRFLLRICSDDDEEYPEKIEIHNDVVCQYYSGIDMWPHRRTYIDYDDTLFP
ncbi:hypothetical protein CVT25_015789 [Psilocybe cyanescens]|uniref:General stress protein FMN-binding split barrel domain-containing protein n=1 Tax=Psilocybe cyanescens TaxID=93625 RepID=A0A409X1H2_PSICY|nr:hypothetical protein CVT25_015789 [Psilocybe cyanescens]